jgi:hypothetical protein
VAALLASAGIACSSTPERRDPAPVAAEAAPPAFDEPADPLPERMPAWVDLGSGAFVSRQYGDAFFGVGRVDRGEDASTLRARATTAARADLARVLHEAFVEILQRWSRKYDRRVEEVAADVGAYARALAEHGRFVASWHDARDARPEAAGYGVLVLPLAELKRQFSLEQGLDRDLRNFLLGDLDLWFRQHVGS